MELICDSGKLTEERTGGFRAHVDHILSRHSPVFRTEQLEARRAVVADCLYRISNLLHRNGTQAGHQAVTVVEDAERQVLAVVDVEHEQLLLGNFADEINVRALVVQVNIDAVHGQTNAVAVYGVYDLERLTHAVDEPLLVVIPLDKESEPDIYAAIKRDALLENVTVDANGKIDFTDKSVTENTRVSYPIYHIENIVKPVSKGPHAKQVIFLSADAFGVLPPVSILNPEQAQYYFLSGFTAKLAGTERGITEPTPTFSACFGAAFLSLHPTKYAEELVKKMEMTGAKAYLVNTGWNGSGKRISIKDTRGIIDAILDGSIDKAPTKVIPFFDFVVPTELPGVDPKILDPRDTYECACQWEEKAKDLAGRFIKNFAKFTGNEAGKALVAAGPKL